MKKKVKKILSIIVLSLGLISFSILPQSPIQLQDKASSPTWDVYSSARGGAT